MMTARKTPAELLAMCNAVCDAAKKLRDAMDCYPISEDPMRAWMIGRAGETVNTVLSVSRTAQFWFEKIAKETP